MRKHLFIFLAALAPAACNVGPNYSAPQIPVEASYTTDTARSSGRTRAWWSSLNDKTLDGLIATAAQNSLDLRCKPQARAVAAGKHAATRVVVQGADGT